MTLDVEHLTITIDARRVVDDISFSVAHGERLGIIGESGSGKSLTALALLGLLPQGAVATGSVRLDGTELLGMPDRELAAIRGRRVGIVFQEPRTALNPIRTVGRQLVEPLLIHRMLSRKNANTTAIELARAVRLPDPEIAVRLYPHQLSGGQRQRVGIAIALACNPTLLIADEPTTALDVTIQAEIIALFDRLVDERGSSLVFITHDLAVLSNVTERAIVLSHGKVIEEGTVTELLNAPRHPVTAALVAASIATSWRPAP
ncbi:MAG: transporter ATP-binding protein [Glaciihabitans sp.]|nr:transporter ATP-binding protein [Glaciihabitans sp.]